MKVAAYIAGDKNIIYPGIITLSSIVSHNSNIDLFMCTYASQLDSEELYNCKKYNINILDINKIDNMHYINDFIERPINKKRYPKEIFYNYYVPLILNKFGYKYAIKVDYDLICCGKYNMSDKGIFPEKNEIFSACAGNGGHPDGDIVCDIFGRCSEYLYIKNKTILEKMFQIKIYDCDTLLNAGFIIFNLNNFVSSKFHMIYRDIYKKFFDSDLRCTTKEEISLSLSIFKTGLYIRKLFGSYNYYSLRPNLAEYFRIKNIHFFTYKPWEIIDFNKITIDQKNYLVHGFLFFNKWLSYCRNFDFSSKVFPRFKEYSERELLNIFANIENIYKQKIFNE